MCEKQTYSGRVITPELLGFLIEKAIIVAGTSGGWIAHEGGEIRICSKGQEIVVVIKEPPPDVEGDDDTETGNEAA